MAQIHVSGTVTDADGRPVSEVEVSRYWMAEQGEMKPHEAVETDESGRFEITLEWGDSPLALIALDRDRCTGGVACLDAEARERPVVLKLEPLVHLHGDFHCGELNERPDWTMAYLYLLPGGLRVAQCASREARYSLWLPPGCYRLDGYGTVLGEEMVNLKDSVREIELKSGEGELDPETIDLEPMVIARLLGQPAPEWSVTAARGLPPTVRLADFAGKWVVMDFWHHWCGPCTHRSLPELMAFTEKHHDRRDRFQVVTFHGNSVASFEELDQLLQPIVDEVWGGKPLSLPILFDQTGATAERYGVNYFPTYVYIDPEGKVAKRMSLEVLEKKLLGES